MQLTRVAPGRPAPSLMHRRRVMADRITYVGLDVHKESIVVAVAACGARRGSTAGSRTHRLRWTVCYTSSAATAWRCGFATRRGRAVMAFTVECVVVAPSLIPKRAGDRVK